MTPALSELYRGPSFALWSEYEGLGHPHRSARLRSSASLGQRTSRARSRRRGLYVGGGNRGYHCGENSISRETVRARVMATHYRAVAIAWPRARPRPLSKLEAAVR